jgi:hypothetical protein
MCRALVAANMPNGVRDRDGAFQRQYVICDRRVLPMCF